MAVSLTTTLSREGGVYTARCVELEGAGTGRSTRAALVGLWKVARRAGHAEIVIRLTHRRLTEAEIEALEDAEDIEEGEKVIGDLVAGRTRTLSWEQARAEILAARAQGQKAA